MVAKSKLVGYLVEPAAGPAFDIRGLLARHVFTNVILIHFSSDVEPDLDQDPVGSAFI